MTAPTAAGVLAVFFLGGLVKGGLGFGLPLVTVSLLPLIVEIEVAFAINSMIIPVLNVWQLYQSGRAGEALRRFWPLILTLSIALPLGVLFASGIDGGSLTLALGIFVMVFTLFQALNPRLVIPASWEKPAAAVTGVAAGVVGGLTTINGPFFVLYLVGRAVEREVMLGALGLFFLLTGLLLTGSFAALGRIDAALALMTLACILPGFAGMALGNLIGARVPQALFRRVVLAGLFIAGANIAARGLGL
ncbi:MAG: TSUP family transporter [Pseudomonadota bacterium]